jgi:hypothetical protein
MCRRVFCTTDLVNIRSRNSTKAQQDGSRKVRGLSADDALKGIVALTGIHEMSHLVNLVRFGVMRMYNLTSFERMASSRR